jgi:hypothetical protein
MVNTSLITRIKQVESQLRDYLPSLSTEIDHIIQTNCKDKSKIENVLDTLIDIAYFKVGQEEFERLNRYYSKISSIDSESYAKKYKQEIKN